MHPGLESIPCPHCDLVQTPAVDGRCRRCVRSLAPPPGLDAIDAYTSESFEEGALPTLPPPALETTQGDDVLVHQGELELDLPLVRTTHLARLSSPAPKGALRSTAGARPITATVVNGSRTVARDIPVDGPSTLGVHVAGSFVDPETGVIRTWLVAVMLLVCVAATIVGRLVRMRGEIVERALTGAEVGGP